MAVVTDTEAAVPRRPAPGKKCQNLACFILGGTVGALLVGVAVICGLSGPLVHRQKDAVAFTTTQTILPSEPVALRARSVVPDAGKNPGGHQQLPGWRGMPNAADYSSSRRKAAACPACAPCPVCAPCAPHGYRGRQNHQESVDPAEQASGAPEWAEHGEAYHRPVSDDHNGHGRYGFPDFEDEFEDEFEQYLNPKRPSRNGEKTQAQLDAERRAEQEAEAKAEREAEAADKKKPQGQGEDAPDTYDQSPEHGMPSRPIENFEDSFDARFDGGDFAEKEHHSIPIYEEEHQRQPDRQQAYEPAQRQEQYNRPPERQQPPPQRQEQHNAPPSKSYGNPNLDEVDLDIPDLDMREFKKNNDLFGDAHQYRNQEQHDGPSERHQQPPQYQEQNDSRDRAYNQPKDRGRNYRPQNDDEVRDGSNHRQDKDAVLDSFYDDFFDDVDSNVFDSDSWGNKQGQRRPSCSRDDEDCSRFPDRDGFSNWKQAASGPLAKRGPLPPSPARMALGPPEVHPRDASSLIATLLDLCSEPKRAGTDGCRALDKAIANQCGSLHRTGLTPDAARLRDITEKGMAAVYRCSRFLPDEGRRRACERSERDSINLKAARFSCDIDVIPEAACGALRKAEMVKDLVDVQQIIDSVLEGVIDG